MPFRCKLFWFVTSALLAVLIACQSPATQSAPTATTPLPATPSLPSLRRDLSQDEEAGGHTLKKHVGRTDEQLRERLRRERNISAASTYTDKDTAERAVGQALQQNQGKIDRWLNREGGHPNLVIDYDSPQLLGRTMHRGDNQSQPCSHALVVLKWDGGTYHVLTTYPECN
ncbi:MAG TPA: RNase A-like domain-containing protein [Terriglobales bacterium]|nr:RNase A-like domain-containing protein [Terriglobales bacterium]